ncbi:MAG TPA: M1 family aminopeptidase [Thermoanaerobaculaceae bacterium]|nr:M1 family aminopeptidase [Thermoanaerobaculaceae bacterium]HRS16783.1 M1 family aminopeptidase [Thermoanaerobaculaceae bacterium]
MQVWRVAHTAIPVPAEGLTFARDVATWRLESGSLRPLEPLADGFVPGFVFEGKGRFTMEIPDAFEQEQLRRFSGKPGLTRIDEPFTRLVLHTSSDLAGTLAPVAERTVFEPSSLLKQRSEEWLRRAPWDVDARVLAGHLTPGDDYLLVDMDTASFGWLAFEFAPENQEEVSLVKLRELNDWVEAWVSLDRASERDADGRPTSPYRPAIDVTQATIAVDLTDHSGSPFDPMIEMKLDKATYRATIAFLPRIAGARALRLYLAPRARVSRVTTGDGRELPFIRDRVGGRFAGVENDIHDGGLTVLLAEPLQADTLQEITVDYVMKQYNYASGRSWYPGESNGFDDLHEARLTFRLPRKSQVRCVGVREEEKVEGDVLVSTWKTTAPTKMLGYAFGKGFKEERIAQQGVPTVVAFGSPSGLSTGNMVRNVAVDVSNALRFYQWYFGVTFPFEEMQATCISGFHGQAFEGFLHLSQLTFNAEHPGASELFRAHEAAHAIWGHMVGWKSYRDQWLSEAFAEYSAMLFVEASLPKEKYFEEILQIYTNEQTGSIKGAFSKFARPWNVGLRADQLAELGPISAGFRASTARLPGGYQIQSYNKGALVLHMMRSVLAGMARDRDLFREVMQDFLKTYTGKQASTDDFRRLVEMKTGVSWKGFFDTWVHGTGIPQVTWSQRTGTGAGGKPELTLSARVEGVAPGFSQLVPVHVVLKGDRTGTIMLRLDAPETTRTIEMPEAPKQVVFAPRNSLLARIKEK